MPILTAIFMYFMIWWTTIFAVLNWGHKVDEAPQTGNAQSAPANARIGRKLLINSGVAFVIWAIIYGLAQSDLISFQRMVEDWQ